MVGMDCRIESLGDLAALFCDAPPSVHEQARAYLLDGEDEVFAGIAVMADLVGFERREPGLALISR